MQRFIIPISKNLERIIHFSRFIFFKVVLFLKSNASAKQQGALYRKSQNPNFIPNTLKA